MIGTVVIGSAALGAWLAAPFVAMGRKGTIDGRSRAGMRAEGLRVEAIRRAHRREALVAAATVSIPAPRGTEHDVLPQRSVLVGV
jgi:prephenate dehydrogenase